MNTTTSSTQAGINTFQFTSVRSVMLRYSVQNTGGSAVFVKFHDASSSPPLDGRALQNTGIGFIVEAGATVTSPVDAVNGLGMTNGIYFQSFALDANRNPILTALSGTCTVRVDSAALQ